ncbi:hypothetical protein CVT25_006581 [Psilocybe cyanescens]|uniref:GST N-terminal domain-containing protein n=1 Tax=Psilocybe cyanescens TaxID=93625 RepID=A0A409X411_PSICY|nr:hypothetical protein CVT25_006581 [Psilocybe cyanescens]
MKACIAYDRQVDSTLVHSNNHNPRQSAFLIFVSSALTPSFKPMTIIPYDIPPSLPGHTWSPNTFKTSIYIADSFTIAEHLDKTYPDTPPIFPRNAVGLHRVFTQATFAQNIELLWDFILPPSCLMLNPPAASILSNSGFHSEVSSLLPTSCHLLDEVDIHSESSVETQVVHYMTIIFYDIPSTLSGNAWSPNTFKTRYTLNFKGIPYTTEWVEYPDIEPVCKKLGIKPTTKNPDGSDSYTLPAIHDPSTGVYIADSILIAEYLDKTYPDTPTVLPRSTLALHHAFDEALDAALDPLWEFILPDTCLALNPRSLEYFSRTREQAFGKSLEDLRPKGDYATKRWGELQASIGKVDTWYSKTDDLGPFFMGNEASWGDIVVASYLIWLRIVWGQDSQQWKDIAGWHVGRWARLLQDLEKYAIIDAGAIQKHISG